MKNVVFEIVEAMHLYDCADPGLGCVWLFPRMGFGLA